jgi:hypothetical protein
MTDAEAYKLAGSALRYAKACLDNWMRLRFDGVDLANQAAMGAKMMLAESVARYSELTGDYPSAEFLRNLADDIEQGPPKLELN